MVQRASYCHAQKSKRNKIWAIFSNVVFHFPAKKSVLSYAGLSDIFSYDVYSTLTARFCRQCNSASVNLQFSSNSSFSFIINCMYLVKCSPRLTSSCCTFQRSAFPFSDFSIKCIVFSHFFSSTFSPNKSTMRGTFIRRAASPNLSFSVQPRSLLFNPANSTMFALSSQPSKSTAFAVCFALYALGFESRLFMKIETLIDFGLPISNNSIRKASVSAPLLLLVARLDRSPVATASLWFVSHQYPTDSLKISAAASFALDSKRFS